MRNIAFFFICLLLCLVTVGQDIDTLKRNIEKRMPAIIEYKYKGIIGENNKGFLELLKADPNAEAIVKADNADRVIIFNKIAEAEHTTAELVGKQRIKQISKTTSFGFWLQDDNGKWYQKTSVNNNKLQPSNMPDNIYLKIKEKCESEWKDDFAMQKHCIERQVKAWSELN